jgi:hypothetical protein
MRKPLAAALILLFSTIHLMDTSHASNRYTSADFATAGSLCFSISELSLSKNGALTCTKGKWVKVSEANDTVATRAFRSLMARYNKMPNSTPNLLVRADPKAGAWKNKIVAGINAGARLWGTSTPDDRAVPAYISEKGEYVSQQIVKDGLFENPEDGKRNRDASARGGGQAGFHGPYFDFIFSDLSSHDLGFYNVGPHEYTHYAQMKFSESRNSQVQREFWIDEGCAMYVGTSLGGVLSLPQDQRATIVKNLAQQKSPVQLSFFTQGGQKLYSDSRFNQVFDIGPIACEALVALKGIDAVENYYRGLAQPESTPESVVPVVFGTSLKSLVTVVQQYVLSVRKGKVMTLTQLQTEYQKVLM